MSSLLIPQSERLEVPRAPEPLVRFQRPDLPDAAAVERYFSVAREQRWFSNFGPCERLFAHRCAEYVGDGVHAVLANNGTSALLLALGAALARAGRRSTRGYVLLPSFTFAAAAEVTRWYGLEPWFVDVDPHHWHMSPEELSKELGRCGGRAAAVIACSAFGSPPPSAMSEAWSDLCASADVPLIIDSAAGFGSVRADGTRLGHQGDAEIFSFHATKPFAIGEGGVVLTRSSELAERMRRMSNFGFDDERFPSEHWALNAKMSEQQAATGLAVLDTFSSVLFARRGRAAEIVAAATAAGYQAQAGSAESAWQFVPVRIPRRYELTALISAARAYGIECRSYYRPLHWDRAFAGCTGGSLGETDELGRRMLCLPMANDLTSDEVSSIVTFLANHSG